MSEMVERVARIISPGAFVFGQEAQEKRPRAMELARAVIQEMRTPTDRMKQVVSANWGRRTWSEYDEVIAAALQDSPPIIRVEGETQ